MVEVVDLALLVLGKEEEEGDEDELAGDEDELARAELLDAMLDDTMDEIAIALLEDEEAAMGTFREDGLVELLEMTDEIDVLTLLI